MAFKVYPTLRAFCLFIMQQNKTWYCPYNLILFILIHPWHISLFSKIICTHLYTFASRKAQNIYPTLYLSYLMMNMLVAREGISHSVEIGDTSRWRVFFLLGRVSVTCHDINDIANQLKFQVIKHVTYWKWLWRHISIGVGLTWLINLNLL